METDPWQQLERVDCLVRARRLYDAGALLDEIEERFPQDDALMAALSDRLAGLLRLPGRFSPERSRLQLTDSPIPVPVVEGTVEGRPGLFIWDSGAEFTFVDEAFCSELGLRTLAEVGIEDSAGRVEGGSYIGLLPLGLRLGAVHVDVAAVVCVDLAHIAAIEPRFLGVLGGNVLGSSSYQLDLGRGQLEIGAPLPADLVPMRARFRNGMPEVLMEMGGKELPFLLDTGADRSGISWSALAELGLTPVRAESRTLYDASGLREESGERVLLRGLRSGEESRASLEVEVDAKNLLAIDFLAGRILIVDRDASLVALTPAE